MPDRYYSLSKAVVAMEEASGTMVEENDNPPPETTRRRISSRARSLLSNSIIETEEQKLTIKEPPPLSSEDSGRYLDIQNDDDDSAYSKSSNASLSSVDTAAAANETSYDPIAMRAIRDRSPLSRRMTSLPIHLTDDDDTDNDTYDNPQQPDDDDDQSYLRQQSQPTHNRGRLRQRISSKLSNPISAVTNKLLHKSTSTPSLHALQQQQQSSSFTNRNNAKSDKGTNGYKSKNNFPWQREDFGKPLMAHRRSLSPKVSSWNRNGFGRPPPSRLENNHILTRSIPINNDDNADRIYSYDIPGLGLDSSDRDGRSSPKHRSRRASMPEHLEQALRKGSSPSEVMNQNALRYLPKILRDTYAQRQTKRPSLLGDAQLASIDLRLRLQRPENLPYYQDIRGSILILDLSGFTALGERLRLELGPRDGAAEFASRVNDTLTTMVRQVNNHWGDVLMFAGDALICLFEEKDYTKEDIIDEDTGQSLSVEQKTRKRVRECCLSVLGKIAVEKDLTIHGGAAHGMIRCFFLGTPSRSPGSCAFIVSGHPLKQTGKLLNKAGAGEVYIDGLEGGNTPLTEEDGVQYMRRLREQQPMPQVGQNDVMPRDNELLKDQEFSVEKVGGFDVNAYAMAYLGTLAARRCNQDSQNAMSMLLNELRPVAVVFVGLHAFDEIDPRDSKLLQLMNEAFTSLSRITNDCNGAVRDMLFDDKGCVFISVFGAHSHEVNPCFDATICAMRMESALKDLGLDRFSLGVSFGECFCGEVGPPMRSDYVVMGPEVNLAARLMGKAPNRSTLVSKRIFTHSKSFIHFLKSEEIQVKGKDGLFHAYIPQTRIERQNVEINEPQQPFVIMPSRQSAMDSLMQVKNKAVNRVPTIAFISGGPFLGKTRLINEVTEKSSNDGFRILKSFRTSLDSFTSFFPLRQIVSEAMIMCAMATKEAAGGQDDISDEISAANYLVDQNIFNKTDRVNIGSIVPNVADAQLLSLLSGINPKARTRSIVDSLVKILKLLQPLIIILVSVYYIEFLCSYDMHFYSHAS